MFQPDQIDAAPGPASKWTPEVRVRFLEHLSRKGNVSAACLLVGASTETAYRLRRRDLAFARGWDAAMVHARRAAEHVLADRAIDGVVVDIYHRGEWIASQRKYDTRLLLAHLGRLDQQVKASAEADAERFDEILAAMIGEPMPAGFVSDDEVLAIDRERFAEKHALAARLEAEAAQDELRTAEDQGLSSEERAAREDEREAAAAAAEDDARLDARWRWDRRHAELCEAVDAVLDGPGEPDEAEARDAAEDAAGSLRCDGEEPDGSVSDGDADFSLRTVSTVSTPCHPAPGQETNQATPEGGPASKTEGSDDRT
jgi:hypothetical protein